VNHSDFGRYLSRQRELRGLSRDEVSRVTKIPPTLVEALEEGVVRRLPERVFVLHYVRAYAEVIGLEPNEAALRYEEVAPPPVEAAQASDWRRFAPDRLKLRWALAIALVALVAGVWAWHLLHAHS
jgi:cytoskeletal protein RodZ